MGDIHEDKKIKEDATNFLFFVQELAAKLPTKKIESFKAPPSALLDSNDPDNDKHSDSAYSSKNGLSSQTLITNSPVCAKNKNESKKFECPVCEKVFKRRSSLSTHKLIHLNVKPFNCPTCSKEFLRRSDLKKHSLMHTGKKPHECPECKKVFSQSSNMLTHMRRHSGVRPFSCHICGHAFYRKVDVRRHQSRHQRENMLTH